MTGQAVNMGGRHDLGISCPTRRYAGIWGGKCRARGGRPICNLYSLTTNQQAIRDLVRVMHDSLGNLEPVLEVYPDREAPVVRNTPEGRELARLTWGMPTPPQFLKAKDGPDTGVTNIRNTSSPHWRRWLGIKSRCLVPATAFSEYGAKPDR